MRHRFGMFFALMQVADQKHDSDHDGHSASDAGGKDDLAVAAASAHTGQEKLKAGGCNARQAAQ